MKTREAFHNLIDSIEDTRLLQSYYQMVQSLLQNKQGKLWESLSEEEQEELLASYDESLSEENLIGHNMVMEKHTKWRKK